jgi:hypothetical protein
LRIQKIDSDRNERDHDERQQEIEGDHSGKPSPYRSLILGIENSMRYGFLGLFAGA